MNRYRITGLVLIFFLVSLLTLHLRSSLRSAHSQLNLLSRFTPSVRQAVFRAPAGWVGYFKGGYVISLPTKLDASFDGVEFLVVSKCSTQLTVELISGAGLTNTRILRNADAELFLLHHDISLAVFNEASLNFQ